MTNNLELQGKALKYVGEKRWDYLLALTFLQIRNYPSWSQRDDFETDWNIGLTSITSENRLIETGYDKRNADFIRARYQEIDFSVGGAKDYGTSYTEVLSLRVEDKTVITIKYYLGDMDFLHASNYEMLSVEELHVDQKIDELLLGIESLIKEHNKRRNNNEAKRRNQQYEGRFSFGGEKGSKTETNASKQSTNENASFKLGKMVGKLLK